MASGGVQSKLANHATRLDQCVKDLVHKVGGDWKGESMFDIFGKECMDC
jgi:hypothetical protein